jgi:SAM-dependent methyltransferase
MSKQIQKWPAAIFRLLFSGRWAELKYKAEILLRGYDVPLLTPEEMGFSQLIGNHHAGSGGPYLASVLDGLRIEPDDTVIDLGCGSAAAIITLAKYPFSVVAGIDLSSEMVEKAHQNLRRAKLNPQRVRISVGNAAEYSNLGSFSHVYMYNPFPESIMEAVALNMTRSYSKSGNPRCVIYKNPVCHDVLIRHGLIEVRRVDLDKRFIVYELR